MVGDEPTKLGDLMTTAGLVHMYEASKNGAQLAHALGAIQVAGDIPFCGVIRARGKDGRECRIQVGQSHSQWNVECKWTNIKCTIVR